MNNQTRRTDRGSKPIERRDRHFDLSTADLHRWHGGSAQISQFYNAMLTVSLRFLSQTARTEYHLLRQDGEHRSPRGWLSLANHLLGRPGLLRQIALPWPAYFRPGFHPWQYDNGDLLSGWLEQDQALSSVVQTA